MTRISYTPQEKGLDDQQWEDLPDDNGVYRPVSPPTTPPNLFKGAARTRRSTRLRAAAFGSSFPRKHVPAEYRGPVRARRERGFVPPQDSLGTTPEPIKSYHQESTGYPVRQHGSPNGPHFQPQMGNPAPQSGFIAELHPQWPPVPQPSSKAELPSQPLAGVAVPELGNLLATSLFHALYYIAGVLDTVVRILKLPISIILAIMVCAYAVKSALAPVCAVPIISYLCPAPGSRGPSRPPNADRTPQWADFPGLLNVESKTLESLLDETVEGPGLALEIKKAEMATSDLATLVRVSKLSSREILADSLGEFVKDARKVGRGLTRFSSKVGGAVDNVIAVNDYVLHHIEGANSRPSGLSLRRLWGSPSESATKQIVTRTFTQAMDTLSANMKRLILEAEVSISDLDKLEEHLNSIHEIVSREDSSLASAKTELLAQLWTKLGGNRDQLKGMDEHQALLGGVNGYRARALAHVVAALQMLKTMEGDMEDLRERVAAPELVGDAIPIEVHMKSLRAGLERLKGRRTGTKELEEQLVNRVLGSMNRAKGQRA